MRTQVVAAGSDSESTLQVQVVETENDERRRENVELSAELRNANMLHFNRDAYAANIYFLKRRRSEECARVDEEDLEPIKVMKCEATIFCTMGFLVVNDGPHLSINRFV